MRAAAADAAMINDDQRSSGSGIVKGSQSLCQSRCRVHAAAAAHLPMHFRRATTHDFTLHAHRCLKGFARDSLNLRQQMHV